MRCFLIADNVDTQAGMRLAGINGVVVHGREETQKALSDVISDPTVGILLINEKLASLCPEIIYELKLKAHTPLVVEIPDRHGTGRTKDSITRYVRDAIGLSV